MSTFFMIHHREKPGFAEQQATYGNWKSDLEFSKVEEEKWDAAGFHAHDCMVGTGEIFCVWEAQEGKTSADMQAHIDSEMPFLNNLVYTVQSSINGFKPKNIFGANGTPHRLVDLPVLGEHGCDTKSIFYMVEHTCKPGTVDSWVKMTEGFVPKTPEEKEAFGKMMEAVKEMGFHGHSSLPISTGDSGPNCFCLWELREDKTPAELQAFHDDGMGMGPSLFTNILHPIDKTYSKGVLPVFGDKPKAVMQAEMHGA